MRRKVEECGGYYQAITWYRQSDSRLRAAIRSRAHVKNVNLYLGAKYVAITCSVCNRVVMLPCEDAKSFSHSSLCERYAWEGLEEN